MAELAELHGLDNEKMKEQLADLIGSFCHFDSNSTIGKRGYKKPESAMTGKQIFDWQKSGFEWTFTATVIWKDYEDEVNGEFLPFFEMSACDYIALRACLDQWLTVCEIKKEFPPELAERITNRVLSGYSVDSAIQYEIMQ